MGYYTQYTLQKESGEEFTEYELQALDDLNVFESIRASEAGGCTKWYEYHEEMLGLSLKFPEVTFSLSGKGEDNCDIWQRWYRNGRWQGGEAKIVYPEFSPSGWV